MATDVLITLKQAAGDLEYPSESDAPFEPFRWPATPSHSPGAAASAHDAVASHARKGATVVEVSVDDFFTPLAETDDAERFAQLRKTLESTLGGLKVFRVGEVKVAIYLIGQTRVGEWAGLRTMSVET
jgi:hypothetical protein